MAKRKIEINEDDFKKIVLMLKLSKDYVKVPADNLALGNLWRVSSKLADKLLRSAEMEITQNKGRFTVKEISKEEKPKLETVFEVEVEEKPVETTTETPVEDTTESPKEETPVPTEEVKVPRCRKRKSKE